MAVSWLVTLEHATHWRKRELAHDSGVATSQGTQTDRHT
jgi:hypothetical protein